MKNSGNAFEFVFFPIVTHNTYLKSEDRYEVLLNQLPFISPIQPTLTEQHIQVIFMHPEPKINTKRNLLVHLY